jgi:HEAT repeat protein
MHILTVEEQVRQLASKDSRMVSEATRALIQSGREVVPALLRGLTHTDGKIRASCALLLDHFADDRCIEPLLSRIYEDPLESVRRCALHSLVCDGCKECPLSVDVVSVLQHVIETDRSLAVKRRAVFYLSQQPANPQIAHFLAALLHTTHDPEMQRRARYALAFHDSWPDQPISPRMT